MANLPITSSNSLPATPPGDALLPAPRLPAGRVSGGAPFTKGSSDSSAVSADTISATQTNGSTDDTSDIPFGALLAQQMDEARTPALIAPLSATIIGAKTTAGSANLTGKDDQDKMLAAPGISNDPASALVAMLQLQMDEARAPALTAPSSATVIGAKTMAGSANLTGKDGQDKTLAAIGIPNDPASAKDATGGTTALVRTITASKAASHQPTASMGATQIMAKHDTATVDNQVVRGASGLEITSSAALTNNLPSTPLPTQNATPLTASVAASAAMPNMLASNRLPDTRQTIATPLGNNSWADEFSQKISWMSTQQNQVAELHLNPPDLGPLDVVLKVSDNQATALFTSPHGAVRDAIENALPKLRETLADNGITLGNTTISDQPPRDRDAERSMNQGSGTAQRDGSSEASRPVNSLAAAAQVATARRHNGMVDTFA